MNIESAKDFFQLKLHVNVKKWNDDAIAVWRRVTVSFHCKMKALLFIYRDERLFKIKK